MSATAEGNGRNTKPAGSLARTISQRKRKRLMLIGGALVVLAIAVGLMLMAFSQDIRFFRTPADLTEQEITSGARFRLGGLVEEGSVTREGSELHFTVTDTIKTVNVVFEGIAPDLFREGQGVVAEGRFGPDGVFRADNVLAKHDENYVPKDLADSLKKKGVWEGQ
ncbi:cytochrome c maturation protein CcmE [Brucella pseudogrignonensis]|uniref:cytochrome c maturation protein CcmE n=1 Tax=Brucella pseudogrignonensis TaxID=419475 RepID=UPI000CFD6E5C|nr:cytochrome c maturation protein CcmE [Brucella pseudogrignonensis]MQP41877.1 cytochrome c maturation protein CcmE [Ochrobactrum sp. MYb237]MCD4511111.1 cytochrome c maturation protein CcmE [Brucella pseudogrignonensis]PQZ42939.1 cytochrome c biogenesis protein CcmE [Brucella pseudogrignonensis]PRA38092.1 cytochrome c biogenesis protein CcmE [Brucella pseudogrignonensis]PRA63598.1 cytochrome c biogenesis protein CcmE [Brucella pseudogrignonensis]